MVFSYFYLSISSEASFGGLDLDEDFRGDFIRSLLIEKHERLFEYPRYPEILCRNVYLETLAVGTRTSPKAKKGLHFYSTQLNCLFVFAIQGT